MATVAELSKMRADLHAARMSGARRFRDQNGEEVEYRSDSEMARALAALDAEIAAAQSRPPSTILFRTSKGL
ncbi:hypothetical protein M8756_10090 [Lutimaribacter sp. EGI FJ00015]|uniref:Uncharacterized protein n=1 Tax=Lutimaribacter degradans TaxID=2945989 RepID=A0ACC5ZWT5_9RHOB|nr:hypothetical protein [Lutimaribacter sp. EGI FJ00013]MCM2562497.1 hypothetical protein [Lutimaribacter sp. EGI FJ00013]MCO0613654.1 hypothetical protein [Lutimaribacter sp. EGI FJ00015]MCO0636626.1 hypothetical protein [Lutimaribacter sp. EGI FJ00014]